MKLKLHKKTFFYSGIGVFVFIILAIAVKQAGFFDVLDNGYTFSNLGVDKTDITLGENYVIIGSVKIPQDCTNCVIESGVDYYGKLLSVLSSSKGACGDDQTVGTKFTAKAGSVVNFKFTDSSRNKTPGRYDVIVKVYNGCYKDFQNGEGFKELNSNSAGVISISPKPVQDFCTANPTDKGCICKANPSDASCGNAITCGKCDNGKLVTESIVGNCPTGERTGMKDSDCVIGITPPCYDTSYAQLNSVQCGAVVNKTCTDATYYQAHISECGSCTDASYNKLYPDKCVSSSSTFSMINIIIYIAIFLLIIFIIAYLSMSKNSGGVKL